MESTFIDSMNVLLDVLSKDLRRRPIYSGLLSFRRAATANRSLSASTWRQASLKLVHDRWS